MNYYKPTPFIWYKILLPFVGILLTIIVAQYFDNKAAKRAKEAEKQSELITIKALENMEGKINKEIVQHYEKIDSLVYVRDSVISEHSTKTIVQLQAAIDSIFNRQPHLFNQDGSGKRTGN